MSATSLKMEHAIPAFFEEVEVSGHIIDSLLLPKILDQITGLGGDFELKEIKIGHGRKDASFARLQIRAASSDLLDKILLAINQHGAAPVHEADAKLEAADQAGAFPEGFYCSTNEDTEVRVGGHWIRVEPQEMDCGVVVDALGRHARCVAMADVRLEERVVIGRKGVRVFPVERDTSKHDAFSFMNSTVSSEKPKHVTVRDIARQMHEQRAAGGKILIVAGPAVVHTGSRDHLAWLVQHGYVDVLFAGNALATHDIEQALYGTSLGISMSHGRAAEEGHEHHLRSINRIRRLGSIRAAVEQGVLTEGVMYELVTRNLPFVLAGSIRDDGPLPDVITDSLVAQTRMRELVPGVTFCLMIATMLHSIAVGNLLPAHVKIACVDINPATVTKLADRGSFQTIGIVTDVEPFLRALVGALELQPQACSSHGPN